jgi:hypothetical protein
MVRPRRRRHLLVLFLLGLALGWPLLGSAPSRMGGLAAPAAAAPAPDDGCAGCGGCAGGGGGHHCLASVCPVVAAVLPAAGPPEPRAPGAARRPADGRLGLGRVPEVQTPPPRPLGVA